MNNPVETSPLSGEPIVIACCPNSTLHDPLNERCYWLGFRTDVAEKHDYCLDAGLWPKDEPDLYGPDAEEIDP